MSKTHNPADSKLSQNIGLLLARVPLGLYLLLDGYSHVHEGARNFAFDHYAAMGRFLPASVDGPFLYAVPFVELAAGAFLVLGIFSRIGGMLATLVLATIVLTITGISGSPFNPILIMLGLAMFLGMAGSGGISVDRLMWGNKKHA